MAVLIPDRVLFLAHPRTASNAMTDALLQAPKAIHIRNHHAEFTDPEVQACWNGELVVSVVRDPLECVLSAWCKLGQQYPTLAQFVREFDHPAFTRHGSLFFHTRYSDIVWRYEDGLDLLAETFQVPLKTKNVTLNKPREYSFSDAELDAIRNRFGEEAEGLGYSL